MRLWELDKLSYHEGGTMLNKCFCRLDGVVIQIGTGSFDDQMAQEAGFCGAGCRDVWAAQKASEMKQADT